MAAVQERGAQADGLALLRTIKAQAPESKSPKLPPGALLGSADVTLSLQGKIIVEEQDKKNWRAALRAEANDRRAAGAVKAKTGMMLKELSTSETELQVETDVNILGKIGEFGQPIIRKKADSMLNEFVENIKKQLAEK